MVAVPFYQVMVSLNRFKAEAMSKYLGSIIFLERLSQAANTNAAMEERIKRDTSTFFNIITMQDRSHHIVIKIISESLQSLFQL